MNYLVDKFLRVLRAPKLLSDCVIEGFIVMGPVSHVFCLSSLVWHSRCNVKNRWRDHNRVATGILPPASFPLPPVSCFLFPDSCLCLCLRKVTKNCGKPSWQAQPIPMPQCNMYFCQNLNQMDLPYTISVNDIATWIGAEVIGNHELKVTGINEIHKVREGDLTFVDHPKYYQTSLNSAASAIIVPSVMDCPPGKTLLVAEKPFLAYEELVKRFRLFTPITATSTEGQQIHPDAIIEPGAIIGPHVHIGKDSYIQGGAIIRPYSYIGERVIIHSGAVIGTQAFYFKKWPVGYQAWTGCGRVIIEDDVWIGSGTTIAQGVSGDTIIGAGTKIDCQVMIGHGVVIGKNCLLAAQAGVAGKSKIGDWSILYGQSGVAQNITIGEKGVLLAQSGVTKDLESGKTYFGSPAEEARAKFKELASLRRLSGKADA